MLLHDTMSHKPPQPLWWRQFSKTADHNCLSVEQRAKAVILFAKMSSVTAMQRRFWNTSWTWWATARNTVLSLFKKFEEEGSVNEEKHLPHSNCAVSWSCESTALGNQEGRQLVSMECLNAQCKEYFKWIWKCFHIKCLWRINFLGRGKIWNSLQRMFFWIRPIFIWMELWINRTSSFEKQKLQRTFTTKAVTER